MYGCRAPDAPPAQNLACLYAENLRGGKAFLFRSTQGPTVGHFDLGNSAGPPFTTNATGLVANLNGDKVDGLDASQLQGQTGPQGPAGSQGPQGSDAEFSGAAAGGDLAGTYPNPSIASGAVTTSSLATLPAARARRAAALTVADGVQTVVPLARQHHKPESPDRPGRRDSVAQTSGGDLDLLIAADQVPHMEMAWIGPAQ